MNQLKNTSGRFSHLCRRITMLVIGMEFATFGISLTAVSNIGISITVDPTWGVTERVNF